MAYLPAGRKAELSVKTFRDDLHRVIVIAQLRHEMWNRIDRSRENPLFGELYLEYRRLLGKYSRYRPELAKEIKEAYEFIMWEQ